ncbi:MAG: isocitrate lyase/PEP mutase family protein [Rhodospirillales bacterium]|nr:isocitrate lyase/PEP mutase family protein [Rhodospirillales bacterium]
MASKGERLRRLIEAPEIVVMPGVFDGFSARLVQQAGFASALISGAGLSEDRLGWPDVGLMGLAENVEGCKVIANCTDLLLVADGDTGYGNAVNVYFTIKALERAGVAGVMIEDQVWPKRCGHMAGKEIIPAEEMVQKVRAACDAREDPNLVIKARTDAAGPVGLDEAIRRGNLYAEAGADLLFADALLSADDIARFCHSVPKPVAVNMGFGIRRRSTTPLLSVRELQEMGVAVVEFPRMLTAAAIGGMMRAMEAFRESLATGRVVERPELLVSFEELNNLMGFPWIQQLERRYLTEAQLKAKYGRGEDAGASRHDAALASGGN